MTFVSRSAVDRGHLGWIHPEAGKYGPEAASVAQKSWLA